MTTTAYRITYRSKADPDRWQIKATCPERWQAEKFIGILETAADVYLELKVEPVPVPNNERKV